jgi:hypothetical protein
MAHQLDTSAHKLPDAGTLASNLVELGCRDGFAYSQSIQSRQPVRPLLSSQHMAMLSFTVLHVYRATPILSSRY